MLAHLEKNLFDALPNSKCVICIKAVCPSRLSKDSEPAYTDISSNFDRIFIAMPASMTF